MDPSPGADAAVDTPAFRVGEVERRAFWLEGGAGPLACWVHVPVRGPAAEGALVLCPPLGYEGVHAHRTLRTLADELAERGVPTLRFDYHGTGASAGEATDPERLRVWLEDIDAVRDAAEELVRGGPVVLAGVRMGATFAALHAAQRATARLVLYAPVSRGRHWVREQQAVAATAAGGTRPGQALEAGGFVLGAETVESLRGVDLRKLQGATPEAVLILERDDLPGDDALAEHFRARGAEVRRLRPPGYADMMAEPQDTQVPDEALEAIVDWVARGLGPARVELDRSRHEATTSRTSATFEWRGVELTEEMCLLGRTPPVFGVLTRRADASGEPGVLLPNAGAAHHVGPNRVYVEVGRDVAGAGPAVLRFDLRNLGDSAGRHVADENHPYPDTAQADIETAAQWLADRGSGEVHVAGICSGAHAALHAAMESRLAAIQGAVVVNPLTFYWEPGMSLAMPRAETMARDLTYYSQSLRSFESWMRMLRGQSDIRYIARFAGRWAARGLARTGRRVAESVGVAAQPRLVSDLETARDRGRPVHFVFSSTDPGYALLRESMGHHLPRTRRRGDLTLTFIADADHTFSRSSWRIELASALVPLVNPDAPSTPDASSGGHQVIGWHEGLWEEIAPVWEDLANRLEDTPACLAPGWMRAWWRTWGDELRPSAHVWRDATGEPVGCILLALSEGSLGPFRTRQALLNASIHKGIVSEHNDILALPEWKDHVVHEVVESVIASGAETLNLPGFRGPVVDAIADSWPSEGWEGYHSDSPYVDLRGLRERDEDYLAALSSNTRYQIRRSIRRYEERYGERHVEVAADARRALELLERMFELHEATWQQRSEKSSLADPRAREFLRELARTCVQPDAPRGDGPAMDMLAVGFGDALVGVLCNFRYRGWVGFYQSGLEYSDDNRLKPGFTTHALAVDWYLGQGADEYDFLAGEPSSVRYKTSLSTDARRLCWATFEAPTARVRVLQALRSSKRAADAVRERRHQARETEADDA